MLPRQRRGGHPPDHDSRLMIFMKQALGQPQGCRRRCRYHRRLPDRTLCPLYPLIPARQSLQLPVGDGHVMQVQTFGAPDGIPALVLHGGPGSGASPVLWRYLDPARYHVVVPDQRGAGGSRPRGGTNHNTTDHLLADLRLLRTRLGIERWLVVGGSWGAALALAHAAAEPQAALGLLLRAVFLAREDDIAWFFQGAAAAKPTAWQRLADEAPLADRQRLLRWLAGRLAQPEPAIRAAAAASWWRWEQALAGHPHAAPPAGDALAAVVDRYRVQAHYLVHGCWLRDPPLLDRLHAMAKVPTLILHAPDDRICRPAIAEALSKRLPHARLRWVGGAGHDPGHPAMIDAMVQATDHFAAHGRFGGA
jgi:proline iminopeptidase